MGLGFKELIIVLVVAVLIFWMVRGMFARRRTTSASGTVGGPPTRSPSPSPRPDPPRPTSATRPEAPEIPAAGPGYFMEKIVIPIILSVVGGILTALVLRALNLNG